MSHVRMHLPLHAPQEVAWKLLVEAAERPELGSEEVASVRLPARTWGSFLRELELRGGEVRKEKVVMDPRCLTVTFTLLDHPELTGWERYGLDLPTDEDPPGLALVLERDWRPRSGEPDPEAEARDLAELRRLGERLRDLAEQAAGLPQEGAYPKVSNS